MTTFTVTDDGIGPNSLNSAINDANASPGPDTILFNSGSYLSVTSVPTALSSDVTFQLGGDTVYISADLAGSGSLTKMGNGTLALSGDNTAFDVALTIANGAVEADSANALGFNAITINNSTSLNLVAAGATSADVEIQGGGYLTVDADFTVSGTFTGTGSAGAISIASPNTLTLDGELVLASSDNLSKLGFGQLVLNGDNDGLAGALKVYQGGIVAGSDQAFGTASIELFGAEVTFSSGEFSNAISAVTSSNSISAGASDFILSGSIDGAGIIYKTGSGSLTLSGDNSGFTGSFFVSGGLAIAASDNALGSGSVTVQLVDGGSLRLDEGVTTAKTILIHAGSELNGAGATSGDVIVDGMLAPGVGVAGVLHTGNLAFNNTGSLLIELSGTAPGASDQVAVTGSATVGGALNISLLGGFSASTSATFTILDNDGSDAITGIFTGLAEGANLTVAGSVFKISYVGGTGNDVTLSYTVPDPDPVAETPNVPTHGADFLTTPSSGAAVAGGLGDDIISGDVGADRIQGNQGNDRLYGGGGRDTVLGGQGDDVVNGGSDNDLLFGDMGSDTVNGGRGEDLVQGNQGADLLFGDAGNDTIHGGQGDDVVQGGDGADYLSGDLGNDVLTGGAGADVFNFNGGAGRDVVADFSHAQGDVIRLLSADVADFASLLGKMSVQGADTIITLGAETIVLSGVALSSLTASDFLFA